MTLPSRREAIRLLEEGHRRVGELLGGRSEAELTKPATIGGGDWSAKDLIGHLAFWEEIALDTLDEWRAGRRPRIEDVFGAPAGIDRINGERASKTSAQSLDEVRGNAERVHRQVVEAIEAMTDDEWTARPFYQTERRDRLGRLLGGVLGAPKRPFAHAFAHIPDLEAYVASVS